MVLRVSHSHRDALRVWYFQCASVPWEYPTLSVDHRWEYGTLVSVARWEYDTLRVSYSLCGEEPALRVTLLTCSESIILSAWTVTSAESIILSALLSGCADSISWEYYSHPVLRVILLACPESIIHAESMIISVHVESIILLAPLWVCAESISAHWEYYSQPALRVILSACPERWWLHKHGWKNIVDDLKW